MIERLIHYCQHDVWRVKVHQLTGLRQFGVKLLRLGLVAASEFRDSFLSIRATSLVYTTLLSLVPFLAVTFSVLKAFGVHQQIEPILSQALDPLGDKGAEITTNIIQFVDNLKVGVLGAVGLAGLFYTTYALIEKIEEALNAIWHVEVGRPLGRRITDYLSMVLVGPVFVFTAFRVWSYGFRAKSLVGSTSHGGPASWTSDRGADEPPPFLFHVYDVHVFIQIYTQYACQFKFRVCWRADFGNLLAIGRDGLCRIRGQFKPIQCDLFQLCRTHPLSHLALCRMVDCSGRSSGGVLSSESIRVLTVFAPKIPNPSFPGVCDISPPRAYHTSIHGGKKPTQRRSISPNATCASHIG